MTPINIQVSDATHWAANQYLNRQEGLTPERRAGIRPLTEYNILAYSVNTSTVLLAIAAISTVFFSYAAAAVFGATALFIRFTASKELELLAKPSGIEALGHVVNQTSLTPQARIQNICEKLGIQMPAEDWTETLVSVFGHAIWKRIIPQDTPLAPAVEAVRERGVRGARAAFMGLLRGRGQSQQEVHPPAGDLGQAAQAVVPPPVQGQGEQVAVD